MNHTKDLLFDFGIGANNRTIWSCEFDFEKPISWVRIWKQISFDFGFAIGLIGLLIEGRFVKKNAKSRRTVKCDLFNIGVKCSSRVKAKMFAFGNTNQNWVSHMRLYGLGLKMRRWLWLILISHLVRQTTQMRMN